MLKNITSELRCNAKDIFAYLIFPVAGWLLGEIITFCLILFADMDTYVPMGNIFIFSALCLLALLMPIFSNAINFNIAISMGRTRKNYIIGITLYQFVAMALSCIAGVILAVLGTALTRNLFYANLPIDGDAGLFLMGFSALMRYWWVIIALPLAGSVLGIITFALFSRFGKKFLWTVWAIWMMATLGAASIANLLDNLSEYEFVKTIVSAAQNVPMGIYGILLAIFLISIFIWSLKTILKTSVTI